MRDNLVVWLLLVEMKLFITVKPQSKEEAIERQDDTHFIVRVKESACDGKANKALVQALVKYFSVAQSRVEIISGHSSRKKVIAIF